MFRKLLCAAMIFSTLTIVACSNNSSSGNDKANQNCVPQTNDGTTIGAAPAQPPNQMPNDPGQYPGYPGDGQIPGQDDGQLPGVPGFPGQGFAQMLPPGVGQPQQPGAPQQPAPQQPAPQQPCPQGNGAATALDGAWMGQEDLGGNGVQAHIRLDFAGTTLKASTICQAGNEQAVASVTVQISVSGNSLTVVEGAQAGAPIRGDQNSCAIKIPAGTSTFQVAGNRLSIVQGGQTLNFTRIGNPPQQGNPGQQPGQPGQQPAPGQPGQPGQPANGVLGNWSSAEMSNDPRVSLHLILTIKQTQMTAMIACIDKQTQQQVQAMVDVPVSISAHSINITRGGQDKKPFGQGGECSIDLRAQSFDYTINGNQMTLTSPSGSLEMTRF